MHQQNLDAARWIISIVFLLGAGIIGGLAFPMWRGKVAPNDTYGVRTKKTVADPALWYRANAIVGRNLVIFSDIGRANSGAVAPLKGSTGQEQTVKLKNCRI